MLIAFGAKASARRAWADRLPINQFSGKVRSAFHGQVETIRPRDGGTRKRVFAGLRLRNGACGPHEIMQEGLGPHETRMVRMHF